MKNNRQTIDTAQALGTAVSQFQSGQFRDAEKLCRQNLKAEPQNADTLHLTRRQKLEQTRLQVPLFDIKRFTRTIENAYQTMWDTWKKGESPKAFAVTEDPAC